MKGGDIECLCRFGTAKGERANFEGSINGRIEMGFEDSINRRDRFWNGKTFMS